MRKALFYLLAFMPLTAMAGEVKSPNGNIVLTFNTDNGQAMYALTYKGKEVVKLSRLGFELAKDKHASMGMKETDLMDGFTIEEETTSEFDETWEPVWGETRTIRNHYNELCVKLKQQQDRHIIIRFRVYDDGIGFRYEFPQQPNLNYFLIKFVFANHIKHD